MESQKLPEHCPGPPAANAGSSDNETSDDNLRMQLHRKDEELQQLRTEIQSYVGKLKGYQTLGKSVLIRRHYWRCYIETTNRYDSCDYISLTKATDCINH